MSPRGAGAVLAGLVLAAGLLIGLLPHSIPGNGVLAPMTCGSAFVPDHSDAASSDLGSSMVGVESNFGQQCSDSLGTPRVAAFTMSGVGALALLFLGLTGMQRGRVAPSREAEHDAA